MDANPGVPARPAEDERARQVAILSPYLPRLAVDWLATSPELPYQHVDGTLVFVDVSGFTKLSERLAVHGKVGGEELASTIDACFAPLLDLAYANGGRLLKFGGDALLVLFTGTEHEVRACRAAYEMRAALRVVGRLEVLGHWVTLRMSVGVNSGRFDMFFVGGSHRELIVAGPAASSTVVMEGAAEAGEILLSEATASALAPSDLGPPKASGRLLRRAPGSRRPCPRRATSRTARAIFPPASPPHCSPDCWARRASRSTVAPWWPSSTSTGPTRC